MKPKGPAERHQTLSSRVGSERYQARDLPAYTYSHSGGPGNETINSVQKQSKTGQ